MRFGKLDDLEKTITIGQKVVEMTTTDDTNFPSRLNDLAIAYLRRFVRLGRMNDISEAIRRHQQVIRLTPDGHTDLPNFLVFHFAVASNAPTIRTTSHGQSNINNELSKSPQMDIQSCHAGSIILAIRFQVVSNPPGTWMMVQRQSNIYKRPSD